MAEERPTGRLIVDILVYTAARIVLVVAVTAAIYYGALQLGFQVPLVVALLFGLIIAMPLGIWMLRGLRERVTAGIAVADERRRLDRERLASRLRGEDDGSAA
ncbi:MAG: DUF4229 domain-containing protein [Mycolicibacterium insubricum]|nr:DUF4229 domain-containing protein [Mycobacterium sp.]